jgi:acetylornithine deacetylase
MSTTSCLYWTISCVILSIGNLATLAESKDAILEDSTNCLGDQCPADSVLRLLSYPSDIRSLAEQLISIPSPSGSEHLAGRYIEHWLRSRGWNVTIQHVVEDVNKRFNVLGLASDVQMADVKVIMSTHFDTVPVSVQNPRTTNSRLYGRGAVDAKGIVAAMMVTAEALRKKGVTTVAVMFVCGEETDHAGMIAANRLEFNHDVALLNGEPTTGRICVKQKGVLKIQLSARGLSCHSGYPELGTSAIDSLVDVIAKLRANSWPTDPDSGAPTTLNVGLISGGTAGKYTNWDARLRVDYFSRPRSQTRNPSS